MKPSQEKIDAIKAQFPDRELYVVEAIVPARDKDGNKIFDTEDDECVMTFLMTGPTREEYKMFINKITIAGETKDKAERLWAIRAAVENAALAQIRWPDRAECQRAFDSRPEMVDGFSDELRKAAGSQIELRSKKL